VIALLAALDVSMRGRMRTHRLRHSRGSPRKAFENGHRFLLDWLLENVVGGREHAFSQHPLREGGDWRNKQAKHSW